MLVLDFLVWLSAKGPKGYERLLMSMQQAPVSLTDSSHHQAD